MAKKKAAGAINLEKSMQLFGFNARRLANILNDREVLDSLEETYMLASSILAELHDCKRLQFLDTEHLLRIAKEGHYQANVEFWHELNRLLIVSCLGEASSLMKIVEGIAWALNSRNEIIFALGVRSYIEHASVLNDSGACVFQPLERISNEVWPKYRTVRPNSEDVEVRDNLIRFIMGRIAQLDENTPRPNNSRRGWDRFNSFLHKVPEKFRVNRKIMDCIDALCEQEGCRLIRAIYELLSEYCHPNSASRSFFFHSSQLGATSHYDIPKETDISSGLNRLFSMSKWAIPDASLVIQRWFRTLSQQKLPMPAIKDEDRVFKPGRLKAVDHFGRVFFCELERIREETAQGPPLTDIQLKRLREISTGFSEVDDSPFSEWVSSFEKEVDPERELHIWGHLLNVYEGETSKRPDLDLRIKKLVYKAIINAINGMSVSEILSLSPAFRSVPDLKRIVQRTKEVLS